MPNDLDKNTISINLYNNRLQNIPGFICHRYPLLQALSVDNNAIASIHASAFLNCSRLSNISIENNKLTDFPAKAFAPLSGLKSLKLVSNKITNFHSMLENICSNLDNLMLLTVDVFHDFIFPKTCNNLKNLTSVYLLVHSYIHFQNSSFLHLNGLPITQLHLKSPSYSSHVYKPLDKNFLSPLSKLKTLHLSSFKVLVSDIMRIILQPLENSTMDKINMNAFFVKDIVILRSNDLQYLHNICVKRLLLPWMQIEYIDFPSLQNSLLFDCLEELDLSYNFLTNFFIEAHVFVASLPKIQRVYFCCQLFRAGVSPEMCTATSQQSTIEGVGSSEQDRRTLSMSSLETKYMNHEYHASYGDILDVILNGDRKISIDYYLPDIATYFEISNNDCQAIAFNFHLTIHADGIKDANFKNMNFNQCNGSLRGMQTLKHLEITNWDCTILNSGFLINLYSLEYLTFSSVKLGENAERMEIFSNLTLLRSVDISCNSIADLHVDFFKSQVESLQHLSLANNVLRHVPRSIFVLKYLQHIDLRMNLISSLTDEAIEFLDKNNGLLLLLGYNDLHCTCNELRFLYWIKTNSHRIQDYEDLQCTGENNVKVSLRDAVHDVTMIELRCVAKGWLYFAIFGNIFIMLCISLVFTLVKFQVDVLYVLTRMKQHIFKRKPANLSKNQYHAFVSYGNINYQWSVDELRPRLESKGFRLLLPDLHFDIGRDHVDNILDAIDQSKRVIFVLTKDFLANEWNEFQIQIARIHAFRNQNENFIIVILRDDMKLHEVPESLKRIWIRVNCLRWPSDNDSDGIQKFWEQLERGLSED